MHAYCSYLFSCEGTLCRLTVYNTAHILELAVYKVAEIAMFDLSTSIKTVWLRQGMYMAHQSHFFPSFCDNSIQGWSLSRINVLLKLHKKQTI